MNEQKLFTDAWRWPGKASINTSTADYLAEHLAKLDQLLHEAKDKYDAGAYGESYAKLEQAKSIADAVEDSSGWAADGYDYQARMYNESYPALQQLLKMTEEAAELENAEF